MLEFEGQWRFESPGPAGDDEQMIWFHGDYTQALIDQTDYPSFDIEGVNKTFMDWEHHIP